MAVESAIDNQHCAPETATNIIASASLAETLTRPEQLNRLVHFERRQDASMNESEARQQLELFLELAQKQGYEIRRELLDGMGSGLCEVKGKPCLFLDLSCGATEQLESIKQTLEHQANAGTS